MRVKVFVVKEQRITWTGQVSCRERKGESSLNRFNVISSIYDKKEETPLYCKYVNIYCVVKLVQKVVLVSHEPLSNINMGE